MKRTTHALMATVFTVTAIPVVLGGATEAAAQLVRPKTPTQTVTTRPRPDYDALGVRVGAFTLFPSVGLSASYNDNIYASDQNRKSDMVFTGTPQVNLVSTFSRHSLNFGAGAAIVRYLDETDEDHENFHVNGGGTLDITSQTALNGGLAFARTHEDRDEPTATNSVEPTQLDTISANAGLSHQFNRVGVRVSGLAEDLDYEDGRNSLGGVINNDDRDRKEYTFTTRVSYDVSPGYSAFVEGEYNERRYDAGTDDVGFNRDSSGYRLNVGTAFDLTGVTFGELFAGYMRQEYDDSRFGDNDGLGFGAAVTWNATQLTTVRLDASRTIRETTQAGSSGTTNSRVALKVDHELLRNLLLHGNAAYTLAEYEGNTSREDDIYGAGLGLTYMMNRNVQVEGGYQFSMRDSTTAGDVDDYYRNVFRVGLRLQM